VHAFILRDNVLALLSPTNGRVSTPSKHKHAKSHSPKPHILLALVDDLGWADVEDHGGDGVADIKTPNFQSLLAEGVRLDRAYSYPWCGPARSSLLSGRIPPRVDVNATNFFASVGPQDTPWNTYGAGIPAGMTGIGTKMKEAGYKTAYTGKWGVGFLWQEQLPRARGFDQFFGYLQDSVDYWTQQQWPGSASSAFGCISLPQFQAPYATDLWRTTTDGNIDGPADMENGTGWIDYQFLDQSLLIIDQYVPSDDTPLFLLHSFHAIHVPLNPPDEIVAPYIDNPAISDDPARVAYAGMVTWVDYAVGMMVDAYKAKGMWENSLVVVTSDNGGPIYGGIDSVTGVFSPPKFGGANNSPLRGGKVSQFDGGIRVVSIASGGVIPRAMAGTTWHGYVHISDWYATFCELAGVSTFDRLAAMQDPPLPEVDSVSAWPVLSGKTTEPTRTSMWISPYCLVKGDWKLLTGRDLGTIGADTTYAFIPEDGLAYSYWGRGYGPWAELAYPPDMPMLLCSNGCLWNIMTDPAEAYEVGSMHPKILEEMKAELQKLNDERLFIPDRGSGTVDPAACALLWNAGFIGPMWQIDDWKWESKNGGVPAGVSPGRGTPGVMMCQGVLDGAQNCAGTEFLCESPTDDEEGVEIAP